MMSKKTALIFYSVRSTFVKKDIEILSNDFRIIEFDFYDARKYLLGWRFIKQKLFLLRHIWQADLLICEFAAYQSYLPALFSKLWGKPCLIVVGGTDAHFFPGIGYGNWQKRFLKWFTAASFRLCSHIAPKHSTLMLSDYNYDSAEPTKQGIYARLPKLKTPYTEIPNGYDAGKWKLVAPKKPNSFITVANGLQYGFQQSLKGIDLILAVAPVFPQCTFTILGVDDPGIFKAVAPNIKLIPPVNNDELIKVFSENEFYMQLSMAEGFPNSICEAMLCSCVPIGSAVFSIPEIIGDSGFLLKRRNLDDLTRLISEALQCDKGVLGARARMRIAENYTLQNRAHKLKVLCTDLVHS